MTEELEGLLTELDVQIDDQLVPARRGRRRRPERSDCELLCLPVAQMLLGYEVLLVGHARWREASDRQTVAQTDIVQG
jgi:hypothetical protein